MDASDHHSAAKTCIIGAGISGLARAWQLKQRGESCTVLEQSALPGGAMRSHRQGDYLAEEGPNSILETLRAMGILSVARDASNSS